MSERLEAAIAKRERMTRGEPEPKKAKPKTVHVPLTIEPDGSVSSVGEEDDGEPEGQS